MTEVSEAAKIKACELLNACGSNYRPTTPNDVDRDLRAKALADFVQQVSDAAKAISADPLDIKKVRTGLAPFILPELVDHLLIEARKLFAEDHKNGLDLMVGGTLCKDGAAWTEIAKGVFDHRPEVQRYLRPLKRGMELAQQVPA